MLIRQQVILKSKSSYIALLVKQHEMIVFFITNTKLYLYLLFHISILEFKLVNSSWNSLNSVIYRTNNWLVSGVINTEMYCINCKEIVKYFLPNLLKSLFHSQLWYFNNSNRFALFTKFVTSRKRMHTERVFIRTVFIVSWCTVCRTESRVFCYTLYILSVIIITLEKTYIISKSISM